MRRKLGDDLTFAETNITVSFFGLSIYILYRFAIASAAINKFSQLPICTGCSHTHTRAFTGRRPYHRWQVEWVVYWRVSLARLTYEIVKCAHDDTRIDHKFTWHVTHFSNISPGEQHPGIRHFVVLAPTTTAPATQCHREMDEGTRVRECAGKKLSESKKSVRVVPPVKHGNWSENTPASRCGKLITKLINFVCRLRFIRVAKGGARHMLHSNRVQKRSTYLLYSHRALHLLLAEIFLRRFLF